MPTCCIVPYCSEKKGGHKFPRDAALQKKWLLAIRRPSYEPSTHSIVCKRHFTEDDYVLPKESFLDTPRLKLKPTAVPSRFVWNNLIRDERKCKGKYKGKRYSGNSLASKKNVIDPLYIKKNDGNPVCIKTEPNQDDEQFILNETQEELPIEFTKTNEIGVQCCFFSSNCLCEIKKEPKRNQTPQGRVVKCIDLFHIHNLNTRPDMIQFYTALDNYYHFMCVYNLFEENIKSLKENLKDPLSPCNQLFLTMIKLRRNMCDTELSFHFKIKENRCHKYFKTWIDLIYCKFKKFELAMSNGTFGVDGNIPGVTHGCKEITDYAEEMNEESKKSLAKYTKNLAENLLAAVSTALSTSAKGTPEDLCVPLGKTYTMLAKSPINLETVSGKIFYVCFMLDNFRRSTTLIFNNK